MSFIRNFPLFTIVLSLFSGALCLLISSKAARIYTVLLESVLTVMVSMTLWYTYTTDSAFTYKMGEFPAPWGNEIRAGVLECVIALTFLIIILMSLLAGDHFLRIDIDESKQNLFFSLVSLMTAALMAMTWTNDIFTGYVFLEILTLTSCGVLIVREIGRTTLAAVRYMILNLLGSGLFLLGVVLLYDLSGHLLMVPMHEAIARIAEDPESIPVIALSVGILTIGLGIKSGLFPFYFWMPDTYGSATPASASLMSSLVTKAYIFLLIKIYFRAVGMEVIRKTSILEILFVLGILGMIFGSVRAVSTGSINRMIAYSSAAQIGYIYMGLGIGTLAGLTGALFQIVAHGFTKSLLFLTVPYLAEASGNSLLFGSLRGAARKDRQAAFFFLIGALSMVGIPFFAGFPVKLLLGESAVGQHSSFKLLAAMLGLAISTLLNAMYFIRTLILLNMEKLPEEASPGEMKVRSKSGGVQRIGYPFAALVLAAANIFLGVFSWTLVELIRLGLAMFQ